MMHAGCFEMKLPDRNQIAQQDETSAYRCSRNESTVTSQQGTYLFSMTTNRYRIKAAMEDDLDAIMGEFTVTELFEDTTPIFTAPPQMGK